MKFFCRIPILIFGICVIIKLTFVMKYISSASKFDQFRTPRQFSSDVNVTGRSPTQNNYRPENGSRQDNPPTTPKLSIKTPKASETVFLSNVTDYPMGVAVGTLVRVYKENGSSYIEQRVGNKYRLTKKLSSGWHGMVFLATDTQHDEKVVIKIKSTPDRYPRITKEEKMYRLLQGGEGFPAIKWTYSEGNQHMMAMDLLGPNLNSLFAYCSRKFSLKTVLLVADQLISRLEYVHSKHIIHGDIKPLNVVVGMGSKSNLIYLIDFGMSEMYRDKPPLKHIPYTTHPVSASGTFASINTDRGIVQSRRDDMESVGYVLVYLVCGKLPWQELRFNTMAEYFTKLLKVKLTTPPEKLCEGLPIEFIRYLNICRSMIFEETPRYSYLRKLFSNAYNKANFTSSKVFDWDVPSGRCKDKEKDKTNRKH